MKLTTFLIASVFLERDTPVDNVWAMLTAAADEGFY
jgi:hypothetical protein